MRAENLSVDARLMGNRWQYFEKQQVTTNSKVVSFLKGGSGHDNNLKRSTTIFRTTHYS